MLGGVVYYANSEGEAYVGYSDGFVVDMDVYWGFVR